MKKDKSTILKQEKSTILVNDAMGVTDIEKEEKINSIASDQSSKKKEVVKKSKKQSKAKK